MLSLDDTSPPVQLEMTFFPSPLGGTTVFVHSSKVSPRPPLKAPTIIEHEQLKGQDPKGRPCEACKNELRAHDWVALDRNGFAINCSIQQAQYEKELIAAGAIQRRVLDATREGMKDYAQSDTEGGA
jgi:hypothetical protein